MKTYQTDENGFYVGDVVADESPLEPGVFMIPGGCVETPPPAPKDGYRARWNGEGWDLIAQAQEVAVTSPEMTQQQVQAAWRAQAELARADFCMALVMHGLLTGTDAIAAARGEWPAAFATALKGLSETEMVGAQIHWAAAQSIRRENPLFLSLLRFVAKMKGMTEDQAIAFGDTLFGWSDNG
jgi:hypothetical protein